VGGHDLICVKTKKVISLEAGNGGFFEFSALLSLPGFKINILQ